MDALRAVELLLLLERVHDEVLLRLLVGEVDAELLERVDLERLEAVDVEDADEAAAAAAAAAAALLLVSGASPLSPSLILATIWLKTR